MKNSILVVLAAAVLFGGVLRAEEKPEPSKAEAVRTYFEHLKSSLSKSAVQGERKRSRSAAKVAAIRGASQHSVLADPDETSLKGDLRTQRAKQAMAEDAEFEKAVSLILAGKTEEGIKALEAFKAAHPKSRSLSSVEEAIVKAKELPLEPAPAP